MSVFSAEIKEHVATAADVTATTIDFSFPYQVGAVSVSVRTTAGVAKAWDGAVAVAGSVVTVDNTGTVDWAATDVVTVVAGRAN